MEFAARETDPQISLLRLRFCPSGTSPHRLPALTVHDYSRFKTHIGPPRGDGIQIRTKNTASLT